MPLNHLLILAMTLLFAVGDAGAQTLPVAGDGGQLWVLLNDDSDAEQARVVVLHRGPGDAEGRLHKVESLTGEAGARGVAARNGRLWVVYEGAGRAAVQSITAGRSEVDGGWRYRGSVRPALPAGATLRALAAGEGGVFALLRVESAEALRQFEQATAERGTAGKVNYDELRNVALGLPPGAKVGRLPAQTQPAETLPAPDTDAADDAEPFTPVDRLVMLHRGGWELVELPRDWPSGKPARMAVLHSGDNFPVLLVRSPAKSSRSLWVYRHDGDGWKKHEHTARSAASAYAAIAVEGQLVLAERIAGDDSVDVALSVLRRADTSPVGQLSIAAPTDSPWGVAAIGVTAALIVQNDRGSDPDRSPRIESVGFNLRWTRMNLLGDVVQSEAPLELREPNMLDDAGGYLVLVSVLVLATLMMLVFWRRDPRLNRVALPESLALADLMPRALAGLIDIAPGFVGVMLGYGVGAQELLSRWPGSAAGMSWEGMRPGAVVIGVFMLHTTVTELLSGRTLGKALTGLRIATLDGRRPRPWQVLVRNALKLFDLIAWLLLILPIIGPFRQRLGDMVARTIVVMKAPPRETDGGEDANE